MVFIFTIALSQINLKKNSSLSGGLLKNEAFRRPGAYSATLLDEEKWQIYR